MGVLTAGEKFRDFQLGGVDTEAIRQAKTLLIIFWRSGCSTSRLALPYFDRIQSAYPEAQVLGVCQDDPEVLSVYVKGAGIRFRQVSDADLTVARLYGLSSVPTYYLVDRAGEVLFGGTAWNREQIQDLADCMAQCVGAAPVPVVLSTDNAPMFKPG
jgi:peroxiredoxin